MCALTHDPVIQLFLISWFLFFCFCSKVVANILPFRVENKKYLDPIWNKHHIERVEIVLKETLDVKGD